MDNVLLHRMCITTLISDTSVRLQASSAYRINPHSHSKTLPSPLFPFLSFPFRFSSYSSKIPTVNRVASPSHVTALVPQQESNQPRHLIRGPLSREAEPGGGDGLVGGAHEAAEVCEHGGVDGAPVMMHRGMSYP